MTECHSLCPSESCLSHAVSIVSHSLNRGLNGPIQITVTRNNPWFAVTLAQCFLPVWLLSLWFSCLMVCAAALCLSALDDTRKLEVFQSSCENLVLPAIFFCMQHHSNAHARAFKQEDYAAGRGFLSLADPRLLGGLVRTTVAGIPAKTNQIAGF